MTMPIDNRPLTQRRLQSIGISVNKLGTKSINIIQSSNNYNIASSFQGSTFSHLHQRLLKSFKEAAISLPHVGTSILEGNLYFGPLENNIANSSVRNDF